MNELLDEPGKDSPTSEDELEKHRGSFLEGKASVALGGTGVVVSGCEACRKRFGTNSQYLRHLANDVSSGIIEGALSGAVTWRTGREGADSRSSNINRWYSQYY